MPASDTLPFLTPQDIRRHKMKRGCAGCTACCYLIEVAELGKPFRTKCRHAVDGQGCSIWGGPGGPGGQPSVCAVYRCAWSMGFGEDDERPDKVGVLVDFRFPNTVDLQATPGFYAIGIREGMEHTHKAKKAVENIARDTGWPVHVADRMMKVKETVNPRGMRWQSLP